MPQIQVWINNDSPSNVEKIVKTLDDAVIAHKSEQLRAFVIFVTTDSKKAQVDLAAIADKVKANDVGLAYIEPTNEAVSDYKINLDASVKNTVMMYRHKKITSKQVNLVADEKGLADIQAGVKEAIK